MQQLQQVMEAFPVVFQTMPGHTDVVEHEGDAMPIRQRPYRIPYSRREPVKKELHEMMAAGMIRPSTSPWTSPIVLVEKKRWWSPLLCRLPKAQPGGQV